MNCSRCGGSISDEKSPCPHCSYVHGYRADEKPGWPPGPDAVPEQGVRMASSSPASESPLMRADKAREFARAAWIFTALSILAPIVFVPFAFYCGIHSAVRGEARKGVTAIVTALIIGAVWLLVALKGH